MLYLVEIKIIIRHKVPVVFYVILPLHEITVRPARLVCPTSWEILISRRGWRGWRRSRMRLVVGQRDRLPRGNSALIGMSGVYLQGKKGNIPKTEYHPLFWKHSLFHSRGTFQLMKFGHIHETKVQLRQLLKVCSVLSAAKDLHNLWTEKTAKNA